MNRLITSLIVVLATTHLTAQQLADMPQLVVGITVDQLRGDYINYLYQAFGEKGFKQLMEKGLVYEDLRFDLINPDNTATMATLMTGAYPQHHGIIAKQRFNTQTLQAYASLYDNAVKTTEVEHRLSPKNLLTSTISDELKIATQGIGRSYAISPEAEQAILAAGHAADGAFWISDENGKWTSSAFYPNPPFFIEQYNRSESLKERLASASWQPLLPIESYRFMPYALRDWGFKHQFLQARKPHYRSYKRSALVNEEVNRMAEQFLKYAGLGNDEMPDFLGITYFAGQFDKNSQVDFNLETQDLYLRLDESLGELMEMIDQTVGLEKTLIYLTSTGHFYDRNKPQENLKIPTGTFHPERCTALLNSYLMAFYGNNDWVTGYHNQQIFLNRKAISNHKIALDEIQGRAAEFVGQFEGVMQVVTGSEITRTATWNDQVKPFTHSYHKKTSGDLLLTLEPGWEIVSDNLHQQYTQQSLEAIAVPLFIFGKGIPAKTVGQPIDATQLAPTVARILRIRSPNGSRGKALPECL